MMIRKILPAFALLIFFVSSGFLPVAAQVDFPIGYVSRGGTYAFITLIEQHKLLEQEGIKPTFVYIGGPQVSQALISGDIRMAIVAAASPIRAAAHGADLRFVAGVTDKEVASFVTAANIKTPADLKGTRLAIDRLGDYSDFRARKVLEIFGLQAQKDVTLLQIGAQTARFAALRSGQVQSTFVVPPLTLVARKAGLRELADLGELGFPLLRAPWSSCNRPLSAKPEKFTVCSAPSLKRYACIRPTRNKASVRSRSL